MRTIVVYLPVSSEDDRVDQFEKLLFTLIDELGILQVQADFYGAQTSGLDFDNNSNFAKTRHSFYTFVAMVNDLAVIEQVTKSIRSAIGLTWPERDDIYIVECVAHKGRTFEMIRGEKE